MRWEATLEEKFLLHVVRRARSLASNDFTQLQSESLEAHFTKSSLSIRRVVNYTVVEHSIVRKAWTRIRSEKFNLQRRNVGGKYFAMNNS